MCACYAGTREVEGEGAHTCAISCILFIGLSASDTFYIVRGNKTNDQ